MVAINSDIPDTTVVGAYVSKSNNHGDLSQFDDMAGGALPSGGYMVTIANKSVKEVPVTLSYYSLPDVAGGEGGYALWGDGSDLMAGNFPVKFWDWPRVGRDILPRRNWGLAEDKQAFWGGQNLPGTKGLGKIIEVGNFKALLQTLVRIGLGFPLGLFPKNWFGKPGGKLKDNHLLLPPRDLDFFKIPGKGGF